MKTFAKLLLVLLFFCEPAKTSAQELDILIDVSDSVQSWQKANIKKALASLGDQDVWVVPWSGVTHTPYRAPAEVVAEHLTFVGGATNLYGVLYAYEREKPVCRKLIVFVDGEADDRSEGALKRVVESLVKMNFLMIVEMSDSEDVVKSYSTLSDNRNFKVINFTPEVLNESFQRQFYQTACVG